MTSLFYIEDLERLRQITDARAIALAQIREALALREDTSTEIRILSALTQKIVAQIEIQRRATLPVWNHAAISDLGFSHEEIDPLAYSILIDRTGDRYLWAVLYFSATKRVASLYSYETSLQEWESLEGSELTIKSAAGNILTIGQLEAALYIATQFGRLDPSDAKRAIEEDDGEDDDDPAHEDDLSGTLKDFSSDPVVDGDDIPF